MVSLIRENQREDKRQVIGNRDIDHLQVGRDQEIKGGEKEESEKGPKRN